MSSDKRRRARVQGGWAAPGPSTSARPDGNKQQVQPLPAWLTKNADTTSIPKYTFEEPEEIKNKPKERVIDKPGVYDLSMSTNGLSRVRLFYNFIEAEECAVLFQQLMDEIPWRQRSDVKDGRTYLQPRLTAWYGDHRYSYSGVTLQANPELPPSIRCVKTRIEENMGLQFNSVLANLYRDGHDIVSWHSDNEPALRDNPTIASVSFGDSRMFEMRQNPPAGSDLTDYAYSEYVKIPLVNGSLLIMEGSTQQDWQHRIPREYHDRKPRINLTFRVIYPE